MYKRNHTHDKTYKSKYKYVYRSISRVDGSFIFRGQLNKNGSNVTKWLENERDAAIWVDKCLIEQGKEPINILKGK